MSVETGKVCCNCRHNIRIEEDNYVYCHCELMNRANKESAKYVFDELLKCDLFRGRYDARNGKEDFMYGVCTVMENIAYMISEECHDRFDTEFMQNMQKSEDKANADSD